jgi:hypothetical protein
MVFPAAIYELEMRYLETMTRPQLLEAARACAQGLPGDLRQGLEEEPTELLRLYVFAGRLIQVLRRLRA